MDDFLYHAFEIDAGGAGLYTALKAKDMKEYVPNVGDTKFQILPPGLKKSDVLWVI